MLSLYFPPSEGGGLVYHQWLSIYLVVSAFPLFWVQTNGVYQTPYSKFADLKSKWVFPSRFCMLIIYLPSMIMFPIYFWMYGGPPHTIWHMGVTTMITSHFAKRVLEALVVHKYSGVANLEFIIIGLALYTSVAYTIADIASNEITSELVTGNNEFQPAYILGMTLFVLGQSCNGYHHWLLACLRSNTGDKNDKAYKVPTGGLFPFVACPHYFGEVVAWLGLALWFGHIFAYVTWFSMTACLLGRSVATRQWYREKGLDATKDWYCMIPCVF